MPIEITIQELARRIAMPERTLRYAVTKGALPARRRGLRRLVVTLADAERYAGYSLSGNSGKSGHSDDKALATA